MEDKHSESQKQNEGQASTLKRSPQVGRAGCFLRCRELHLGLEDCVGLRLP